MSVDLYGTDQPSPEAIALAAGPLAATLVHAALRDIRLHGVEIVRGIDFVVRDRAWGTMVPALADVHVEPGPDRFAVRFSASGTVDGVGLSWRCEIEGTPTGLRFAVTATPAGELVTCRTGFAVLHPLDGVVGAPVTIEHTDGTIERTNFPELIDPIQCFSDIRAMTHEPLPGTLVTCRMEGAAEGYQGWETEDHRNWTDASFKTYFRPLALPWPYALPAGQEIAQSVTVSIVTQPRPARPAADPVVTFGDRTGGVMPAIGIAVDATELAQAWRLAPLLRPLGLQILAVRVRSDGADLPGTLRLAARLAAAVGAAPVLEIVVAERQDPVAALELVAVAAAVGGLFASAVVVSPEHDLRSYPPSIDRPPGPPLHALYEAARVAFPGLPLGGGMFSFFTELNRRRPPPGLDFIQHATAANVHAGDDRSVMETLESLPHVFRAARAIAGGAGYRVGPARLTMPFGTGGGDATRQAMASVDAREGALFGAAWATGYLARAAAAGVGHVTLFSPAILLGAERAAPAFHVLQGFAALAGAATVQAVSSTPTRVLAVAAEGGGRRTAWLANLTAAVQPITLAGVAASEAEALTPEGLVVTAGSSLAPYSVTRHCW